MSEAVTEIEALERQLESFIEKLRPRHLIFAQALAEGKTGKDAYLATGGKASDPIRAASEMLTATPEIEDYVAIALRIATLKSQDRLVATRAEKRAMLWEGAQDCMNPKPITEEDAEGNPVEVPGKKDIRGMVSCIQELNRMDGDHAPTKTEVTTGLVEGLINELTNG